MSITLPDLPYRKDHMKQQDSGAWSPYLAGALSGVVGIFSVWFAGQYFGASTSFVRTAGMIEQLFGPERVAQMSYFIKVTPKIDWQWMFMVGIFLGAMIAALASGSFKLQAVPDMWAASPCLRSWGSTTGSSFPCLSPAPCCCFGGWKKKDCDGGSWMKIYVFEVEDWERQTFESLQGEHQIEFVEGPLTREAVERILSTTVGNIASFTRGEPENVISAKWR